MVAAYIRTVVYGMGQFTEMFAIEMDTTVISDPACGIGIVAIGASVFGDLDGKLVVVCDTLDDVVHASRIHFPANFSERAILSVGKFKAHRSVRGFRRSKGCGRGSETAEVIVDADVIDGGGHSLFVAALEAHGLEWSAVNEGLRVMASECCLEKPDVVECVKTLGGSGILWR